MSWREHIARYGTAKLPGERWMRRAFIVLLLLAAVLRFWDLPNLPYTHDELSALVRLYPTLGETIQKGVIELDTHPPGVQVFEWLWTRVFTMNEADVKLPFILMGLLALLLLYRFALAWTSAGPALVLVTLMATLQYSVLYGQIARPYAAGLFTTALLADQLTRYLAFGQRRMLIGVGIAAVLSAYTHHFSLMLAALMVGTGLLLLETKQRRAYLIMCAIGVVLYLPNIPIFLKQLGQGGLSEWLQAPDADWMPQYGWFIANNNNALATILLFGVAASVVLTLRKGRFDTPMRWHLLLWGAVPLIVGYAYSVWRAPVLQYSMVLFSFPYIVLFLLQGLVHLNKRAILVACGITAFVAVKPLVEDRHHYELFYRSKYEVMLRDGIDAVRTQGTDRTLVLFDAPDNVLRFYLDQWGVPRDSVPYIQLRDSYSAARLDSLLATAGDKLVVYGCSNGAPPEHAALVQSRFPQLIARHDLTDGQVFRFVKHGAGIEYFDRDTLASLTPKTRTGNWQVEATLPMDSIGWNMQGREFGILIELPLDSVVFDRHDQVEVIAQVDGWNDASDAAIVADVKRGDSTVFYRGGILDRAHRAPGAVSLIVAVSPADVAPGEPLLLRTYIYSPAKDALRVRRIDVLRRDANVLRYGTLSPVPWMGRFSR